MLSDPISVTYNATVHDLVRVSNGLHLRGEPAAYVGADGEFELFISSDTAGDSERFEVILRRRIPDSDTDPFNGPYREFRNGFGFVFEVDKSRYNASTDLPLLQSAITSLVTGPFLDRILGGER